MTFAELKDSKKDHMNRMTLHRNNCRARSGIITARRRTTILTQKRALQKSHHKSQCSNALLKPDESQINQLNQYWQKQDKNFPINSRLIHKRQSEQVTMPMTKNTNLWINSQESFLETELQKAPKTRLHSTRPRPQFSSPI